MIKIIISGTSDGFYPRYASDTVLSDEVTQHLLDRRRLLTRQSDRLYKEGYSFQQLDNLGILFHKIILLFDGFGRDGFMMASLFLPIGDKLDGKDIKDALDSIILDYKSLTINGIANFDIDWSFVNRIADELNNKVQFMTWMKQPRPNDASLSALMKGAENNVADYFQYPNPLNKGFDGIGQVFLSESILDPEMVSSSGEQGYKVLTLEDVDIYNPEYSIQYENDNQGATLSHLRKTINKKELTSQIGDLILGTLSKPGYRDEVVSIIDRNKTSVDGLTITVPLPTLQQKNATLEMIVFDKDKQVIPLSSCIIKWRQEFHTPKQKILCDGKFSFVGEECDTKWFFSIEHKSFQTYSSEAQWIIDGNSYHIEINLIPKPKWNIYIQYDNNKLEEKYNQIAEDDLKNHIDLAKKTFIENGWEIESITKEEDIHKVIVKGKKKNAPEIITNGGVVIVQNKTPEAIKIDSPDKPHQNKKSYYLSLNKESKNYSLFKKYRKILNYAKTANEALEILKNDPSISRFTEIVTEIKKIQKKINEYDISAAKSEFEELIYLNPNIASFTSYENAKKAIEEGNKIPEIVESPKDVKYDLTYHCFVCERTEKPSSEESIVLAKDKYEYSIPKPKWEDTKYYNHCYVKRALRRPFKIIYSLVSILVLLGIGFCIYCFSNDGGKEDIKNLKDEMFSIVYEMSKTQPSYCGDDIYFKADSINKCYMSYANKDKTLLNDSIYNIFKQTLVKQAQNKQEDSTIFNNAMKLLDMPSEKIDWLSFEVLKSHFDVLTKEHIETLVKKMKNISDNENVRLNEEEVRMYNSCMSEKGTINDCNLYINKYNKKENQFKEYDKKRLTSIRNQRNKLGGKLIQTAKDKNKSKEERLNACEIYIQNFPNGNNIKLMKEINSSLSNGNIIKESISSNESTGKIIIKNISDLFNALIWENAQRGEKEFNQLFSIENDNEDTKKSLEKQKKEILDAIYLMNIKERISFEDIRLKYEKAYDEASRKKSPSKKMETLKNNFL